MIIWLPMSGVVAGLVGLLIAPISVRLKGLNLGFNFMMNNTYKKQSDKKIIYLQRKRQNKEININFLRLVFPKFCLLDA